MTFDLGIASPPENIGAWIVTFRDGARLFVNMRGDSHVLSFAPRRYPA